MVLSEQRADAVRLALLNKGIEGHRLASEGKGERVPLMNGTSETARAKNRRVEFLIEYK
jgi:outer membrane protein OmpA-like peptidoglycan-associated protein